MISRNNLPNQAERSRAIKTLQVVVVVVVLFAAAAAAARNLSFCQSPGGSRVSLAANRPMELHKLSRRKPKAPAWSHFDQAPRLVPPSIPSDQMLLSPGQCCNERHQCMLIIVGPQAFKWSRPLIDEDCLDIIELGNISGVIASDQGERQTISGSRRRRRIWCGRRYIFPFN